MIILRNNRRTTSGQFQSFESLSPNFCSILKADIIRNLPFTSLPERDADEYLFESRSGERFSRTLPWVFVWRGVQVPAPPLTASTEEFIDLCMKPKPPFQAAEIESVEGIQGAKERATEQRLLPQRRVRGPVGSDQGFFEVPPCQLGKYIEVIIPSTDGAEVLQFRRNVTAIQLDNTEEDWTDVVREGIEHACQNSERLIIDVRDASGGVDHGIHWLSRHLFPEGVNKSGTYFLPAALKDKGVIVTMSGFVDEPMPMGNARGGPAFDASGWANDAAGLRSWQVVSVDHVYSQFEQQVESEMEMWGVYRKDRTTLHLDNPVEADLRLYVWSDSPETDGYVYGRLLKAVDAATRRWGHRRIFRYTYRDLKRSLRHLFHNGTLVGTEFTSSFKQDGTDFEASKLSLIEKGKTSKAEVIQLLGTPGGSYMVPLTASPSELAMVYQYSQTKGSAFNLRFYTKPLQLH